MTKNIKMVILSTHVHHVQLGFCRAAQRTAQVDLNRSESCGAALETERKGPLSGAQTQKADLQGDYASGETSPCRHDRARRQ